MIKSLSLIIELIIAEPKCDRCDVNYYGRPAESDGSCTMCECNGNTDTTDRESCDQTSGKCLKCMYNTYGDACGECAPGFYGNAANHHCVRCECNTHGTQGNSADNCDSTSGQCRCLPNVVGAKCDQCKADHYGLETGNGCLECACDTDGTKNNSATCHVVCSLSLFFCFCRNSYYRFYRSSFVFVR